jgi:hypothetical protein
MKKLEFIGSVMNFNSENESTLTVDEKYIETITNIYYKNYFVTLNKTVHQLHWNHLDTNFVNA